MVLILNTSSAIIKTFTPAIAMSFYRSNHTAEMFREIIKLQKLIYHSIAKTEIIQYNLDKTDHIYNINLTVQNNLKACLNNTDEMSKNIPLETKFNFVDRYD